MNIKVKVKAVNDYIKSESSDFSVLNSTSVFHFDIEDVKKSKSLESEVIITVSDISNIANCGYIR